MASHIADIERELKDDTESNLRTYRNEVTEWLNRNIVMRHSYSEGAIEYSLSGDKEIAEAVKLLATPAEYNEILTSRDTQRK